MEQRTLKFRAWDNKNKKFPFKKFYIVGETTIFDLLKQYKLEECDDLIIQQFTGLQDNKGEDIYEGDILIIWIDEDRQTDLYEVKDLRELYLECNRDDSYYRISSMKIVGNIFENPELLK